MLKIIFSIIVYALAALGAFTLYGGLRQYWASTKRTRDINKQLRDLSKLQKKHPRR